MQTLTDKTPLSNREQQPNNLHKNWRGLRSGSSPSDRNTRLSQTQVNTKSDLKNKAQMVQGRPSSTIELVQTTLWTQTRITLLGALPRNLTDRVKPQTLKLFLSTTHL